MLSLFSIALSVCFTWYTVAFPLSFWMLTRGSPGQGVLNTAWEPPAFRGFPK